jgi:predicted MPP superfamily phosphohydrolase
MAKTITFLRAHKRAIVLSLIFAYTVFLLIYPDEFGRFYAVFFGAINVALIASQVFWIRRVRELGKRLIPSKRWRWGLGVAGLIIYFSLLAYNLFAPEFKGTGLTLRAALLEAPFQLWLLGSMLGFLIAMLLGTVDRFARVLSWGFKKVITPPMPELSSPGRRRFLEQTAIALSAAPFVVGTYGLFYGRLNVETTQQRIRLRRLPRAFDGFRIVQLSDLHISPFMSAEEIRRYVGIANQLKGDLVVLTGDFLTYDPSAEGAVVQALSGLKAPFGVFGCLGNHEIYTETEDSITRLFAAGGTRILRGDHAALNSGGSVLNLMGVDYQSRRGRVEAPGHPVREYLQGIEQLLVPDTVNILLSHNPNTFDRAAELGIDLSLGGHTHGGQVTLDFIHPSLSPSRLITPYVRGLFQKGDSQLYVNRGIGTVDYPSRFGSRPEITVFELVREV